uniref:non-specific serine/threonine protein kinase n=1 Tax=Ciona savignyi TaxID=51511 RepID=H2YNF5_CIOSA
IVKFRSIKPFFQTCGGVNLPKVVVAVGSDGLDRKHLVKGRDDLRQDAVMQQVFQLVNVLLAKDPNTKSLSIQTYKVVPLSQKSGLVQWCDGTIPIGVYLKKFKNSPLISKMNYQQGEMGAHHRHRPHDMSAMACRKALGSVGGKGLEVKFGKYKEICAKFKPVQSYTKSVAVSSIVGYVLGLGDRHVQNILINCNTAEIVHIDLGKCLPTPETVPFRLTRDIVDGMGLCGVEGVFRRCCEKTMVVMRSSYDAITTIVEVLLYDPLHDWTLSPSKARTLQVLIETDVQGFVFSVFFRFKFRIRNRCPLPGSLFYFRRTNPGRLNLSDAQNTNKLAERVLLRLQEKLLGTEEGSVLSVRGQVNMLIQQASDPVRLCQLFAGWQPYL